MATFERLTPEALEAALTTLPEWRVVDGALERHVTFRDFSAAFAFMTRVALEAHRLNHHPTWTNTYNRVQIRLTTHAAGNEITSLDMELARRIQALIS